MSEFFIESPSVRYTFSDLGGELISAKQNGRECIWTGAAPFWPKHAPILFPICGALKDARYTYNGVRYALPKHGFFLKTVLKADKVAENKIVFTLKSNEETKAVYPFDFLFTLTYEAVGDSLYHTFEIKNLGRDEMPFALGGHPAFMLEEGLVLSDYEIAFPNAEEPIQHLLIDGQPFISEKSVPVKLNDHKAMITDAEYLYSIDTVILTETGGKCVLASPKSKHGVEIRYDSAFRYLCYWKWPDDKANFLCLEPWTGAANDGTKDEDFNTREGMIRLAPGEVGSYAFDFTLF